MTLFMLREMTHISYFVWVKEEVKRNGVTELPSGSLSQP